MNDNPHDFIFIILHSFIKLLAMLQCFMEKITITM